jgi:RNA polymerase sigma-70 factor (sigma-E family)
VRSRDKAAYTDYVAARQDHLRRIAYALCGDWHRAEDLLQTALVKLYVAWPRRDRWSSPEAYVRQILVRASIDEHRRAWRRHEVTGLQGVDPAARAGRDAEERDALFAALDHLSVQQRACVVLRYWLELTTAETAAELGISEGAVKTHASRGRERLRAVLTEVEEPEPVQ